MTDERYRTLLDVAGRHAAGVPLVIARSISDRALADELRKAAMAVALPLAGWEQDAGSKLELSGEVHHPAAHR